MNLLKKIIYLILVFVLVTSCSLFKKDENETKNNTGESVELNNLGNEIDEKDIELKSGEDIDINNKDIEIGTGTNESSSNNKNINSATGNKNNTSIKSENGQVGTGKSADDVLVDETIKEIDDLFKILETENGG